MRRRTAGALSALVVALLAGAAGCGGSASPRAEAPEAVLPITSWELTPERQALFDGPSNGLDSLQDCGFTTIAFVRPDQVARVERLGLRALVGRPGGRVDWAALTDAEITRYVEDVVAAAGASPALDGYFIADEPSVAAFPALRKAVAAVRRLAPGKLAYVNLLPDYATPAQLGTTSYRAYLERYVREVRPQLVSYDNYSVLTSRDLRDRARAASFFRNLLEVRRVALRNGLPFWVALASNRIRPTASRPSPANLRLQAYATLAAGARGLTWFTYYAGVYTAAPVDPDGRRTRTWSALQAVNRQVAALAPVLLRLRSTGVFFTRPAPASTLPTLPGRHVLAVRSTAPVMVGELAGPDGTPYALLVNLDPRRPATLAVVTRTVRLVRISPVDGTQRTLPSGAPLRLAPGEGALVRL